jgi:hypothetical protein
MRLVATVGALVVSALSGCGLIFQGTTQKVLIETPPETIVTLATAKAAGRSVQGDIEVRRNSGWLILRAERPGYQPVCRLVQGDKNNLIVALDAIPAALPLAVDFAAGTLQEFPPVISVTPEPIPPNGAMREVPSVDRIASKLFSEDRGDVMYARTLCSDAAKLAVPTDPSHVLVTSGPLNQKYRILGEVSVETDAGSWGTQANYGFGQWAPSETNSKAAALLRTAAVEKFGPAVDAVINVDYSVGRTGRIQAQGLAVQFAGEDVQSPVPAVPPMADTPDARLKRVAELYKNGLINRGEYDRLKAQILSEGEAP